MKLIEFYNQLLTMNIPFFRTRDVAVFCKISNGHASQLLLRLTKSQQLIAVKKGVWALPDKIEQLMFFSHSCN